MRVLVCGSRYWGEFLDGETIPDGIERVQRQIKVLHDVLHTEHENQPFTTLIEGEAPGADTHARVFAEARNIPVEAYPADWKKHGKRAGPIRNTQMLDEGNPDFVIAFTDDLETSRGTRNMVTQARARDIPVRVVGSK